jgi:hypothetical protein
MVLTVTYAASSELAYRAADWWVVDSEGRRYASLGAEAPDPALRSGRLAAGESITANVAFERARGMEIVRLVLTDRSGADLIVVDRDRGA